MPTIKNKIKFSKESAAEIAKAKASQTLDGDLWSSDSFLNLRREVREFYRNEQRLLCAYCKNPVSDTSAAGAPIDHIVPKSSWPKFMFEPLNLCITCPDCNETKRAKEVLKDFENPISKSAIRYPRSSNSFKIVHPHFDKYEDHLYKANRIYIDISEKGTWTLSVCKLNRFFHRFGASDELINDLKIIESEERFHEH